MELKGHHSKNIQNNFTNKISGIIICTFIKNKMFEFNFFQFMVLLLGLIIGTQLMMMRSMKMTLTYDSIFVFILDFQ